MADRVTKKKLTLAEAADQWIRARGDAAVARAEIDEAAGVLLAHFDKTGRTTYRDLVAVTTRASTVLDQPKVREFLGKQLQDFQKRVESRSLTQPK